MTDLTNEALNEAVALALGLERAEDIDCWTTWEDKDGRLHGGWATNAQACLDDLLPMVRAKYPEAKWRFTENAAGWAATCESHNDRELIVSRNAPTRARAICKVFMEVMK